MAEFDGQRAQLYKEALKEYTEYFYVLWKQAEKVDGGKGKKNGGKKK